MENLPFFYNSGSNDFYMKNLQRLAQELRNQSLRNVEMRDWVPPRSDSFLRFRPEKIIFEKFIKFFILKPKIYLPQSTFKIADGSLIKPYDISDRKKFLNN